MLRLLFREWDASASVSLKVTFWIFISGLNATMIAIFACPVRGGRFREKKKKKFKVTCVRGTPSYEMIGFCYGHFLYKLKTKPQNPFDSSKCGAVQNNSLCVQVFISSLFLHPHSLTPSLPLRFYTPQRSCKA